MPLVVGAPDGRTCIDSAAFYDKYSCHVDEEEGSRGVCMSAAVHPAGLLYTAHEHWMVGLDAIDLHTTIVHVWDVRPHHQEPKLLHSFFPADHLCSDAKISMHIEGDFLGVACPLGGRPQIRHALRPAALPGTILQSKLQLDLAISADDRTAMAMHLRAASRDLFVGYYSGKVAYFDLESGVCINFINGMAKLVTGIASHGKEVFIVGRGAQDRACVSMCTTAEMPFGGQELRPRLLRPWGAFLSGGHQDRYKLLPSEDSPMQPNALLVDGERLLVGANDRIYVWSGLEQPQDAPPALAHVLEVQHSRRGGGRNIDGVCALAVAPGREQMFVGINGAHGFADGSGPPNTECTVQVWHLPCIDLGGSSSTPSCLHVLPAGCMGSITAMLLVSGGARLFAWSSDKMLRVWQIHPEEGTGTAQGAASSSSAAAPPPAPWEIGGGALHPSLADGRGTLTEEEPWEWDPGSDDESSVAAHTVQACRSLLQLRCV